MAQWFGLGFRDDTPMVGPPSCTAADFKVPRLRRCPFDPEDLVFEARLGGGADGCVWKVRLGREGPFALKMVSVDCLPASPPRCLLLIPTRNTPPVLGL